MKKATCCDAITESPQRIPRQVAPMQNPALLKFNTEESFLLPDTTFKIITLNRSFKKRWTNYVTEPVDLNRFIEVVKSFESFRISIVRVPQKN